MATKVADPKVANPDRENPGAQKRLALYAAMPPATKLVADKLRSIATKVIHGNLLAAYKMGEQVKMLLADRATYGFRAVEQVAEYIGSLSRTPSKCAK